jgi:hypothetical protein
MVLKSTFSFPALKGLNLIFIFKTESTVLESFFKKFLIPFFCIFS